MNNLLKAQPYTWFKRKWKNFLHDFIMHSKFTETIYLNDNYDSISLSLCKNRNCDIFSYSQYISDKATMNDVEALKKQIAQKRTELEIMKKEHYNTKDIVAEKISEIFGE